MSESALSTWAGQDARGGTRALFGQTMGYVAVTAGLFAAGAQNRRVHRRARCGSLPGTGAQSWTARSTNQAARTVGRPAQAKPGPQQANRRD